METKEIRTREWTDSDGTEWIETTTIEKRIKNRNSVHKFVKKLNIADDESDKDKSDHQQDKEDSSSSSDEGDDFAKEALQLHNKYRKKHGANNLVLSKELCSYAQDWANRLARSNCMQHRSNNKYGENIYYKMSTGRLDIKGSDPVESWYGEVKDYNYNRPGFSSRTGHFTQVVWRGSKRLGIAYAKSGNSVYVVANYDPPGNFMNQFRENVLPPQ